MSDLNVKFHSSGGKRRVLIVDDEAVNREILGYLLEDEYDISFAATGGEALEAVRGSSGRFSLILLDLLMPDMHGFDVLRTLKADPLYSRIPVIVLTADSEAEVESLSLGAVDFIPKPYPLQDVILARVRRTIELSENRDIISYTERDSLTGLYNKEFFFLYAAQYDEHHSDAVMDAIIVDINHFHMINERHGRDYGDRLLKKLGSTLLSIFREDGGIVCRREADTFLIYCPHRSDYQNIIEKASAALESEDSSGNLRLRMGVYSSSDKSVDIEHRFDRAKSASDTIRNSYNRSVAVYDMKLHESALYAEQLVDDFSNAIKEEQFQVYFQPKFDIRVAEPVLCSAEALVRWSHPAYGMISPGIFIPLFEKNGLIKDLDTYVWRQTAKQISEWKERFGRAFPVSVNVSRIDLYDPGIFDTLQGLLSEYGLTAADMLLEVTESAYTEDSSQIIEIIKRLRDLGFRIEMDDFGSGYSSLNMVSTLPIDALKLDMMFIRNAFSGKKDTHIIETIIEIADHLSVPVIAEGVETEDQVRTLKSLGCAIVQGYYFSKPLPAKEYGRMVEERVRSVQTSYEAAEKASKTRDDGQPSVQDVSAGGEEKKHAAKSARKTRQISLRRMSMFVAVLTLLIAVALFASDALVNSGYNRMSHANERYVRAMNAATELEIASDYLTDKVRSFVVTGNIRYMEQFFEEVEVNRRRDRAVEEIRVQLEGSGSSAYDYMLEALALSNQLVADENLAMRYTLMTIDFVHEDIPAQITEIELSPEDERLTARQLQEKAEELVYGDKYETYKTCIRELTAKCTEEVIRASEREVNAAAARMNLILLIQPILTVLFIILITAFVLMIRRLVIKPLGSMVDLMRAKMSVPPSGSEEIQFVTRAYNEMLDETLKTHEQLTYESMHDGLTGLYNRKAYDVLSRDVDFAHSALIVVDIDNFRGLNEAYGTATGNLVLKRVAGQLRGSFRSVDSIFRFGGDEFVVIMTRVDSDVRDIVLSKMKQANMVFKDAKDGLPEFTVSAGAAFGDRLRPQGDIFSEADAAMNRIKQDGGCGCGFAEA